MSSFGLGGALLISQQLESYRWEDHFRRQRGESALAQNDAAWRSQCDNLVRQYNQLLMDANAYANTADQHIAWQAKQIADLQAENEALRLRAEAAEGDLAILDVFVRETRPEASGLHYD